MCAVFFQCKLRIRWKVKLIKYMSFYIHHHLLLPIHQPPFLLHPTHNWSAYSKKDLDVAWSEDRYVVPYHFFIYKKLMGLGARGGLGERLQWRFISSGETELGSFSGVNFWAPFFFQCLFTPLPSWWTRSWTWNNLPATETQRVIIFIQSNINWVPMRNEAEISKHKIS